MKMPIVILYSRDIARARHFYTEVVGMAVDEDQSGPQFVMLKPEEGSLLALEDVTVAETVAREPGSVEIGLHAENVDAVWTRWKQRGVELITEPVNRPFGRTFIAKDPDGHYLTVYGPTAKDQ